MLRVVSMFTVIPVVDLLDGQVVHARRGERGGYRPIETPLSPSAAPEQVVRGLRNVFPFAVIYIADLGAILQRGDHREQIDALIAHFPTVSWWVDAGIRKGEDLGRWQHPSILPVLGSESLQDAAILANRQSAVALSLDQKGTDVYDPAGLHGRPELWPDRVIAMTLHKVGSGEGPDMSRLGEVLRQHRDGEVYAAGGVRGDDDLRELKQSGIRGALVATALHHGGITAAALRDLQA